MNTGLDGTIIRHLVVDVPSSNLGEPQLGTLWGVVMCPCCVRDSFVEDCVGDYLRCVGDIRIISTSDWWWISVLSL